MTKGILSNPIVQVALALVVILVIATLTFASAISGALTAERKRHPLFLLNRNHGSWFARPHWADLGAEVRRWSMIPVIIRA